MTIKEAILKSLEDIKEPTNYIKVCDHITAQGYIDWGMAKTPSATISALLGDFIRNGDARVKRIKMPGNTYNYYLTKNEGEINIDAILEDSPIIQSGNSKKIDKNRTYEERDLHKLLVTYLKSKNIFSKTIYHEQSRTGGDSHQIWTHPDIVGIELYKLQTKTSQNFRRAIKSSDTFRITSYELKKEINSDTDLKKAFFQAVSNSSWANDGYLVALEFSGSLQEEMKRLSQTFGIGIIKLNSYPYLSEVLFPSTRRELDFKSIDKLCNINPEFQQFIENCEKLMTADERYISGTEKELNDFCDTYFKNEDDIINYCSAKNISMEDWPISRAELN
ncbi:MAG: hypothetical protein JST83_07985 [Bacteroidetes bacterium]|nr:hypothetical protein [Bacteroidota bacterium]